ncbi:N-methyltransferase verN [Cladobotryum mycophilum]|uniref:N-methyltransferase verN n=1 Tax=Cladobotryum mycophilum TaxID=491253 RepID=A0ABR0S8K0_9HYPO
MAVDTVSKTSTSDLEESKKAYMLPNNYQEILRMKNQHEWIKGSFGGLIKAPIDYEKKGQKILDSAAADGTWLSDASTLFVPETELVGFDIAPELFPPKEVLPANVKLVPGDLSKDLPAEWSQYFDLVHQRFVFPGFPSETIEQFLGRLTGCVKPGGWIQLIEPAANEMISGPDPTAFNVLHNLANMFMKTPNPSNMILSKLKSDGFINISVHSSDLVIGKFQENKELSVRGRRSMRDAVKNMSGMSSPQALNISQQDYDSLLERFDADTERYRTAVRHTIIWAQRPE